MLLHKEDSLDQMVLDISKNNVHNEVDWGPEVGKEEIKEKEVKVR